MMDKEAMLRSKNSGNICRSLCHGAMDDMAVSYFSKRNIKTGKRCT